MTYKFLAFIMVAVTGLSLAMNSFVTAAGPTTSFLMSPTSATLAQGASQAIALRINATGDAVNVVTADVVFDSNRLELSSVDYSGSAYETKAEEIRGNGTVRITRGSNTPKTGQQTLAKLTFKARNSAGTAPVNFTDASAAYSPNSDGASVSNTAGQKTGAVLTVQSAASGSTTPPPNNPSTPTPNSAPSSPGTQANTSPTTSQPAPSNTSNASPQSTSSRPSSKVAPDPAAAIAATATTDDASRITDSPLETTIAKEQEAAHAASAKSTPVSPGTVILFIAAGFAIAGTLIAFLPGIIQRAYQSQFSISPAPVLAASGGGLHVPQTMPNELTPIERINAPNTPAPSAIIKPNKDFK